MFFWDTLAMGTKDNFCENEGISKETNSFCGSDAIKLLEVSVAEKSEDCNRICSYLLNERKTLEKYLQLFTKKKNVCPLF